MPRLSESAREERTEERRAQILRAALDVFSRKGFHGATIREIASVAGLAEGTIYLYFASKQELLKGVFALIAEEAAGSLSPEGAEGGDDAAFLTALVRNRIQTLSRYAALIRLLAHEADLHEDLRREFFARLHEPFVAFFDRYLQARIAREAFRPVNTSLAASICFRLIMSYVMTQHVLALETGLARSPDGEYIDAMVDLVLYGLVSRPPAAG
jgi:AcrR family transcriptional regulator